LENITDIIEGCKKRDIQSQKKLYLYCFAAIKHRIRYYIKDADVVNDLIQECFLKLFDKISGYSGSGSFDGWVNRMASNIAIDYYRKHNKSDNNTDIDQLADSYYETEEDESIINQIADIADMEFIQDAIAQLPFRIRMVFIFHVIENKSHEEIANELHITISNSRKRLQIARTCLKEYLMNYHKEKYSHIYGSK
jgi:RNA polymerase sigma factor (sigma-70 family)